jgi:hypothetical protein
MLEVSAEGTWERCSEFVEEVKRLYTVISYNFIPTSTPDKDGNQTWRVDVKYVEDKE